MPIRINGKLVSGGAAGASNASEISYDNTSSGLEATTVKTAIDELSQEKLDKVLGSEGQVLGFDDDGNIVAITSSDGGVGKNVAGKTYTLKQGRSFVAKEGAEIFNDYSDRTYANVITYANEGNVAIGKGSHAEGIATTATDHSCHAEGWGTYAGTEESYIDDESNFQKFAYAAHAEGMASIATGMYSHAEGYSTICKGDYGHTEGMETETDIDSSYCHAEGSSSKAYGLACHAEGYDCYATGQFTHAGGELATSKGQASFAFGIGCVANSRQFVFGEYNVESTTSSDEIILGVGSSSIRANCFRATNGGVYSNGNYRASGADYAEMFEWEDSNPKNEDRRGLFVTLKGNKIKLADSKTDYILGVVSCSPSVIGGVYDDQWKGMYLYDIFGTPIYEEVEVPEKTIELPDKKNPKKKIKKVISEAHTEMRMKLNPDYDSSQKYTPRSERPEWDAVGMLGQLVMVDDGLCEIDGYCKPGDNGIAVWSKERTKYRVIERLDNNHIKVLIL